MEKKIKEVKDSFTEDAYKQSTEKWFRFGKSVLDSAKERAGQTKCPICDTDISARLDDILKNFNGYFDKGYESFIVELKTYKEQVRPTIDLIDKCATDAGVLGRLWEKYKAQIAGQTFTAFDFKGVRSELETVLKACDSKLANIQFSFLIPQSALNALVKVNTAIEGFDNLKTVAQTTLGAKQLDRGKIEGEIRATYKKMTLLEFDQFGNGGNFDKYMQNRKRIAVINTTDSMTVSKENMCPADRILYQLRSLTGSVESAELAASSIASKQLAVPCDYLILDTRYGKGAFFEKKDDAIKMATLVEKFLTKGGMSVDITYTDTPFPNGSSIGNALEVEEAIYILTGNSKISWNEDGIKEQKKLLFSFLSLIMQKISGDKSFDASNLAERSIKNGAAKKNLANLLKAHKVSEKTINAIFEKSFATVIGLKKAGIDVIADKNFIFDGINQRDVGNLVNFDLGAARYEFGISEKSMNGLLMYHRPNDLVKKGDAVFSVYSTSPEAIMHKKEKILATLKRSIYERNNMSNDLLLSRKFITR